jgi:predicted heme/steroid binding protein
VAGALAACATSGADNLHGPVYENEAGPAQEGGADAAAETSTGGAAGGDAGGDVAAVDGPVESAAAEGGGPGDGASETGGDTGTPETGVPEDTGAPETGATCTSSMALLAASASSLGEAVYGHGLWSTATTVTGGAAAAPTLVPLGSGYLASFVGAGATGDLPLKWTAYAGSSWTAPAAIGAALGQGTPALAVIGTTGHVVYWGSDSKFYHGTYSGSAWDAASDPVGGSGASQSFGPSAPAAASTGTTLLAVQSGSNGLVYDESWTGSWQAATALAGSSVVSDLSPAVVAMNGGAAELLQVFVHAGDAGSYYLEYATRTAGTWSAPANVYAQGTTIAYAGTTPALAALPSGGAILAWQGSSPAYPYVSTYSAAGWTAPVAVSSDTLLSPPSVAPGVCGADAVMAYVKTGGAVTVVTTSGGTWATPQPIAGATGMQWVAVAAVP